MSTNSTEASVDETTTAEVAAVEATVDGATADEVAVDGTTGDETIAVDDSDAADVATLRSRMIDQLHDVGEATSEEIIQALSTVPREAFAPGAPLEQVYDPEDVVVTRRDSDGKATSSVSATRIQAMMLDQANLSPGMKVLEIGSGGYNAALIAELVGPTGQVTSIDIDDWVTERAARFLAETGYADTVDVVTGDAEHGAPDDGPFDAIIVTVGAWDIPPAWTEQLAPDGTLVVPLRMCGGTRSIGFRRDTEDPTRLVSTTYALCGFVPMLGAGAHSEHELTLRSDGDATVTLKVDGLPVEDETGMTESFAAEPVTIATGVTIQGGEAWDDLDLYVTTVCDQVGYLSATREAVEAGAMISGGSIGFSLAVIGRDSLAYRSTRKRADDTFEFVIHGHGPNAPALIGAYARAVREWDQHHRGSKDTQWRRISAPAGSSATISVTPAVSRVGSKGATRLVPTREGISRVINKAHTCVTLTWPTLAPIPQPGEPGE